MVKTPIGPLNLMKGVIHVGDIVLTETDLLAFLKIANAIGDEISARDLADCADVPNDVAAAAMRVLAKRGLATFVTPNKVVITKEGEALALREEAE